MGTSIHVGYFTVGGLLELAEAGPFGGPNVGWARARARWQIPSSLAGRAVDTHSILLAQYSCSFGPLPCLCSFRQRDCEFFLRISVFEAQIRPFRE